jgi:exosortase B
MTDLHVAAPPRPGPAGLDAASLALLCAGCGLMIAPTLWDLIVGSRSADSQGHEPIVVALCGWLLWRCRRGLAALPDAASRIPGALWLGMVLLVYVLARSREMLRLEMLAGFAVPAGLILYYKGWRGLRECWFPLFFLGFAVPLPFSWVLMLTAPMKAWVSAAATALLSALDFPVGRSGVVITIGQYELLVTEACAGLQTMFTLEALGLLYANLRNHPSVLYNALLAVAVIPISFCANVIRVIALALVTYTLGDAAGQGMLHGFAGMVLFGAALALIVALDTALARVLPARAPA